MSTIPPVHLLVTSNIKAQLSDEIADQQQVDCGRKHREIVKMHAYLQNFNDVQVLLPYGFDKNYLHQLIEKEAPTVLATWHSLGLLYQGRPAGQEAKEFLDRRDVASLISLIDGDIVKAFAKISLERHANLEAWLQPLQEKGTYLMVRSSGDEDGAYANAGGNESSSYVLPTVAAVFQACGRSVASFFGVSSLLNRLNAGVNPFEQKLELGVFVQELIGESPNGNDTIPISVVLFSNKLEYGGNEHFRIMRISATYGHGEAIVGNKGCLADTYYLLQSRVEPTDVYIISDIKEKVERLAPVWGEDGKVHLVHKQNLEECILASVLSNELLVRLFALGKSVEAFRDNRPSDMEIVIKDNCIYPVQARDANARIQEPSYLDHVKVHQLPLSPIVEEFFGQTQVPGKAAVVVVDNPNQMLACSTLEQAEKRFIQRQHSIILFQEEEPADSHFIVNFSDLQIPCIRLQEQTSIQKVQQQIGEFLKLVVNVQEGSLHLWDGRIAAEQSCISKGFYAHPAPLAVSLDGVHLPYLQEGDILQYKELQALIRAIKSAGCDQLAHRALAQLSERQEFAFLQTDWLRLNADLEQFQVHSPRSRIALKAINALDLRLKRAFQEALPVTAERLERLFHVKVIENLLFQMPGNDGSVGKLSLVTAKELVKETEKIISYAKSVGKNAKLADLVLDAELAPLPRTKELWLATLQELEKHHTLQAFFQLLDLLRSSQSLGVWMTLMIQKVHTTQESLFAAVDLSLMKELQHEGLLLRKMRRDIAKFADPACSTECIKRLLAQVAPYTSKERLGKLRKVFSEGSLPAALLAQATLNEVVDLFDKAIKSIKASPEYTENQKILIFCGVVDQYAKLFESWMAELVTADDLKISNDRHNYYPFQLRKVLDGLIPNEQALQASRWFEVPPALITSQTLFERHLPVTAEDIFTLVHQNLLAITSALMAKVLSPDHLQGLGVPTIFKLASSKVSALGPVQFLGLNATKSTISLCYNLTIRSHSATFELFYNVLTDTTTFQFHFLGQARERWGIIRERLCLLQMAGTIQLNGSPEHSTNALHISLLLNDATLDNSIAILKSAVVYSLRDEWADTFATNETWVQGILEKNEEELIELCRFGLRLTTIMPHIKEKGLKTNLIKRLTAPTESCETKIHALRCLQDFDFSALIPLVAWPLVYDYDPRVVLEAVIALNCYLEKQNPLSLESLSRLKQDSLHLAKEKSLDVRLEALILMKNLVDRGDSCADAVRYAILYLLEDTYLLPEDAIKEVVEIAISKGEHFLDLLNAAISAQYAHYRLVNEVGRWILNKLVNSAAAINHIEQLKSFTYYQSLLFDACTAETPHEVVIALASHFCLSNVEEPIRQKALKVWYDIGSKHPDCTAVELAHLRQILVQEFLVYTSPLRQTADSILNDMSFRGQNFPEMMSAAVQALFHPEEEMRERGYWLFHCPIADGLYIEEATHAAKKLLAHPLEGYQKLGTKLQSYIDRWKK